MTPVHGVPASGETLPIQVPSSGKETRSLQSFLETLSLVVGPTTLLSALMFYFGWRFTNSRSLYFGIDPSTLGLSNQDYLLRSVEPIFVPAVVVLLLALLLLGAHAILFTELSSRTENSGFRFRAIAGLAGVGALLLITGLLGIARRPLFRQEFVVPPLGLAVGSALLAYTLHVWHVFSPHRRSDEKNVARVATVGRVLLSMLIIISLFWAVGDWADALGRGRGKRLAEALSTRPGVVLYTKQRLQVEGRGVEVSSVEHPDSAHKFRYSGLRLLIRSGGNFFLLPEGWTRDDGVAIVIRDSDDVRFEFTPR